MHTPDMHDRCVTEPTLTTVGDGFDGELEDDGGGGRFEVLALAVLVVTMGPCCYIDQSLHDIKRKKRNMTEAPCTYASIPAYYMQVRRRALAAKGRC
jgi:hypothetical protein